MPNPSHAAIAKQLRDNEQRLSAINPETKQNDDEWSDVTKDLLDSLPQVWTRGLLYFLVSFVSIILPWAVLSEVDETGTARGRLEPRGKTVRLDAAVSGTVTKIHIQEGENVKSGQIILELESDLVKVELRQSQEKLNGQIRELSQLNLLKNQLMLALRTQQQQNQAQELEKQAQIDQARQNISAIEKTALLEQQEKGVQINQAQQTLRQNQNSQVITQSNLASAQREVERYEKAFKAGIVPEINLVDKKDEFHTRKQLYQQAQSDIEQAKLRIAELDTIRKRSLSSALSNLEQGRLQLKEQERSFQTLTSSGKLALLKSEEQLKSVEREISTLQSDINQNKDQIESLKLQLAQRILKAPLDGTVFRLPIQKAGAVVQPGAMVAELAPQGSPFIIRAQMATSESGSLRKGLPVKLKFDAYPFQDYGIIEGELVEISPTSTEAQTPNEPQGVAFYTVEIALKQNCIPTDNKCTPLRPGDTATAEVIVRQRRIIDLIIEPFKHLQKGGLQL